MEQAKNQIGEKVVEKAADVVNKMDEKDKQALKDQAIKTADNLQNKAANTLKTAKAVLESPEANIVSKVAGKKVEEKREKAQNIVNDAL
jgi:hypothetical protein